MNDIQAISAFDFNLDVGQLVVPRPQSLLEAAHEKVIDLAEALGIPITYSIGIIESLRLFSRDYAKHGNIGKYSNEAIAESIFYDEDADRLVAALARVGWIVPDSQCRYRIVRFSWKKEDKWSRRRDRIKAAGGEVSRFLRRLILSRDGHRCVSCNSQHDLTIDHKYPVSLGGKTVFENLQTLCRRCNGRKKDRLEVSF